MSLTNLVEPSGNKISELERTLNKRRSRRAYLAHQHPGSEVLDCILPETKQPGHFGELHHMFMLESEEYKGKGINLANGLLVNWITLVFHGQDSMFLKAVFRALVYKCSHGHKCKKGEKWMPPHYLVSAVQGGETHDVKTSFGTYQVRMGLVGMAEEFHKRLLKATEHGVDSCMHGILSQKFYNNVLNLGKGWYVPLVSPIGYSPKELTTWENKIRDKHHAGERKEVSDILFDTKGNEIREDIFKVDKKVFSYIIKGPSAGNEQPWRFYVDGDTYHLCVELSGKEIYRKNHLNEMDAGIAMATFSMLAKEYSLGGEWTVQKNPKIYRKNSEIYIASYIIPS